MLVSLRQSNIYICSLEEFHVLRITVNVLLQKCCQERFSSIIMRFGHYHHCRQETIRITSLHIGGNRSTCTTYRTLNCDIPKPATPLSLRSTRQVRLSILLKDTNTLALTTFGLRALLCSARPHALIFNDQVKCTNLPTA